MKYFSVFHGEIIENYPDDKPYPSCLVMGKNFAGEPIHSVWAYNLDNQWGSINYSLPPRSCTLDRLESEGNNMTPFKKCPVCGGELEVKQVEKLLRGGGNTVALKISAEVCLHCGERLYAEDVVRSFEEIRSKLQKQEFAHLKTLGQSFTVSEDWPNKSIQPTS